MESRISPGGGGGSVAWADVGSAAGSAITFLSAADWVLFTGFISSLYSLYIHLTIATVIKYCQYTKTCLFSMVYKLVLLYVKVGIGRVPTKSHHGDTGQQGRKFFAERDDF